MASETSPKPKFLICFTPSPVKTCCCLFSLNCAIYFFATLDILHSFGDISEVVKTLSEEELAWPGVNMGICAVPFAVMGIVGVAKTDTDKMHAYFVYKEIESITLLVNAVLYTLIACTDKCADAFLVSFTYGLFECYFAFIVWSAEIRVKETVGATEMYRKAVVSTISGKEEGYVPPGQVSTSARISVRGPDLIG